MKDYAVRASAANEMVRVFACISTEMVEQTRQNHNTSPVMTAALGRLLTAGSLMGLMMKNPTDLLTLEIGGAGPGGGLLVTATSDGYVKGYPKVSDVILPPKNGKLDVGGAFVPGILRVIKDMGLKEPYNSTVALQSGEIAEDLTYYFATSEQIPSSVGLGVLMNKDNTVKVAGGFILQLMPFADDKTLETLENNIKTLPPVTDMLSDGLSPEDIIGRLFDGLETTIHETMPIGLRCDCGKERITKALMTLPKSDIEEMINDGKPVEVRCQFCCKKYDFSKEDLINIREKR